MHHAVIEKAVRDAAASSNDPYLTRAVGAYDAMKAEGRNVEFRLDMSSQQVKVVEIQQVTVDLAELEGEVDPDAPKIDFAYADEE